MTSLCLNTTVIIVAAKNNSLLTSDGSHCKNDLPEFQQASDSSSNTDITVTYSYHCLFVGWLVA